MELVLKDVAKGYGLSVRAVQMAVADGSLCACRQVGRSMLVDDIAALAWARSLSKGRRWSTTIRSAVLDLLTDGTTAAIEGTAKSRLKGRLRTMTARDISYATGGLGLWARYRKSQPVQVSPIGPSAIESKDFEILGGAAVMDFGWTTSLDSFEQNPNLALDADGLLGMVERKEQDDRFARTLIDTYLLGDSRLSATAARLLEERARGI